MTTTSSRATPLPAALDIVRGVALIPMAFVVASTTAPGFLLCVPAFVLAGLFVAIPLVALAVAGLAAVAVVAIPYLAVRGVVALATGAARRPQALGRSWARRTSASAASASSAARASRGSSLLPARFSARIGPPARTTDSARIAAVMASPRTPPRAS